MLQTKMVPESWITLSRLHKEIKCNNMSYESRCVFEKAFTYGFIASFIFGVSR